MKNLEVLQENCLLVSSMMKSISHPQRLMLLCHLAKGEKTVNELKDLCQISQSQMSQFLRRMLLEKILDLRKEGQYSYYRISDKKVANLILYLENSFCAQD